MAENETAPRELHFWTDALDEASELVEKFHYSHRVPPAISLVGTFHEPGGLFGDKGRVVAACFLRCPPTRWNEPVIELTRLVRRDETVVSLTKLISLTMRAAKKSGIDLVVSYADSTHGHHGGVYQAASWNYSGKRSDSVDGLVVNGVFVPGRQCYDNWGTRSPSKVAESQPHLTVESHTDSGKHLYWKPLTYGGAKKAARLGLEKLPYPKPKLLSALA